jgi:hypothetical protein
MARIHSLNKQNKIDLQGRRTLEEQIASFPRKTDSESKNAIRCGRICGILRANDLGDLAEQVRRAANPSGYYYQNTGRDFALEHLTHPATEGGCPAQGSELAPEVAGGV